MSRGPATTHTGCEQRQQSGASTLRRHTLGRWVGRRGDPGVAAFLPHRDGRRREIGIGEGADRDGNNFWKASVLPLDRGTAHRAEPYVMLRKGFSTLSLSSFPACRDPYSSCSQGAVSRFFPRVNNGSALGISPSATSDGERFWSCSHSFTFRPTGLFASQVAPTLTLACRAAETFTAAHITVGYLPRAAAMLTIQTGQLMVRGLAPLQIRQTCWLLRSLALVSLTPT